MTEHANETDCKLDFGHPRVRAVTPYLFPTAREYLLSAPSHAARGRCERGGWREVAPPHPLPFLCGALSLCGAVLSLSLDCPGSDTECSAPFSRTRCGAYLGYAVLIHAPT